MQINPEATVGQTNQTDIDKKLDELESRITADSFMKDELDKTVSIIGELMAEESLSESQQARLGKLIEANEKNLASNGVPF